MAWAALGLFAVFMVLGFGVRTWLQVRRTGDSGFRGLSGVPGSAEWWAGVLFAAATLAGAGGPIASLLGVPDLRPLDATWIQGVGISLALLGIGAAVAAQITMGINWRVGVDESERTSLVASGPFAIVRNPFFSATLVTGLGIALMVPNPVALLGWLLLLVACELQVRVVEEPYLMRAHGAAYQRYLARVGRFLPAVGVSRGGAA